jgi:hypothetical protein
VADAIASDAINLAQALRSVVNAVYDDRENSQSEGSNLHHEFV